MNKQTTLWRLMRLVLLPIFAFGAMVLTAQAGDVGDTAKLKTVLLDGKAVSLDQLKGKVVMVNFWASWCSVCRAEMPAWQKLYDAYHDKGFELLAMSIDEDVGEFRKAAKERGYSFPMAWRWDDKSDDNFGDVVATPTLYVVDKTGKVAWTQRGRLTYAQLQQVIEPLLKN